MPRPFVTLNCAASIDGKITTAERKRVQLSCEEDRRRVLRLRGKNDAVAVGIGTVLADDPLLLPAENKKWAEKIKRVIFDSKGRTPEGARTLAYGNVIVFTSEECNAEIKGAEVIRCGRGKVDVAKGLEILHEKGVESLLLEGGGELIYEFLVNRLVDLMFVYTAPVIIGGRGAITIAEGKGLTKESDFIRMRLVRQRRLGVGYLSEYKPEG
ncbi:MAG: dihydrofolate reductase family protein [Methanomassiliicoccales archaeon]